MCLCTVAILKPVNRISFLTELLSLRLGWDSLINRTRRQASHDVLSLDQILQHRTRHPSNRSHRAPALFTRNYPLMMFSEEYSHDGGMNCVMSCNLDMCLRVPKRETWSRNEPRFVLFPRYVGLQLLYQRYGSRLAVCSGAHLPSFVMHAEVLDRKMSR